MRRSSVVLLLVAAFLVSCGKGGGGAAPVVHPAWTSCAGQAADTAELPRLDDSFQPVAAVVCPVSPQLQAGVESRATEVTALVAALRLPDERRTADACTLELYQPPFLALLDAQGRWVQPGLPGDACGKVRIEVREALDDLRLTPVSAPPVQETEAAEAGCSRQWADMVWAVGAMGAAGSGAPAVVPPGFDGPVPIRLCVYRVPEDQQGTGKPAGDFVAGRFLDEQQWAAVTREIEAAPAAPACTTPAGRFAVLHFGAGQLHVELDGCRRLLAPAADGAETLRQASKTLVGSL
jgi:hypothetical protein